MEYIGLRVGEELQEDPLYASEIAPAVQHILAASRESVFQYQSVEALAEVWDCVYRHVWWAEPLQLDRTRHFSPERKPRSFTEDPSRADFWPVPVDDLLDEILVALKRVGVATSVSGPKRADGASVVAAGIMQKLSSELAAN